MTLSDATCSKCNFRLMRVPVGNYQDKDFDHEYIIYTKCINPFCKESAKHFSLD